VFQSCISHVQVYDSEEDMVQALERGEIVKGEKTVVIIRYEGPKGGPGMPEMRMGKYDTQ
jgi:dihydroxy-acid dehydratase